TARRKSYGTATSLAATAGSRKAEPRLLADPEPEDGGVARSHGADRFQVDPGQSRGRERDAIAEQQRQHVDQDLVDEPSPQTLARHVGAEDLEVLAARSIQCG